MFYIMRSLPSARRPLGARGGSALPFPKSRGLGNPLQQPALSRFGRFRSKIRGFPPGVAGPEASKERSSTRCALVPGMEKKSGSGPDRN